MIPCPECARFIQVSHDHCPFCDHRIAPPRGSVLASAVLGLTLVACNGGTGNEGTSVDDDMNTFDVQGTAYAGPDVESWSTTMTPPETTNTETSATEGTTATESGSSSTAADTTGSGTADSGTAGSGTADSGTAGSSGTAGGSGSSGSSGSRG